MTNPEILETRTIRAWLGEDGIMYVETLPGAEINEHEAHAVTDVGIRLAAGEKRLLCTDARGMKFITREARDYLASGIVGAYCLALAILVDSPVNKVLMNFFITVSRPVFPTRLFTSKAEALAWLMGTLDR